MRLHPALIAVYSGISLASAQVYNDGTQGSVTGPAGDWGATYHASGFAARDGCLDGATLRTCYTFKLSSNTSTMLETADYPPYVNGGVGTRQRALLLSAPHYKTGVASLVNHRVFMHIGKDAADLPEGEEHVVTLAGMRNGNASFALGAFDLRARRFPGDAGASLYGAVVTLDGAEDAPTKFPLAQAAGRTLVVKYDLAVNGMWIDYAIPAHARLSVRFADTNELLLSVEIPENRFRLGIVDEKKHWIFYGADRAASPGMRDFEVSFGDYFAIPSAVSPLPPPIFVPVDPEQ